MEFWCHNERVWKTKTSISLGTCCKNTRFRCFTKRHRKWRQAMFKNDLKIKLWVLSGRIFQIWGVFLRGLILGEFSICTNSVETLKKNVPGLGWGAPVWKYTSKGGGGGGEKGGRYRRFLIGDNIGDLIWHADLVGRRIIQMEPHVSLARQAAIPPPRKYIDILEKCKI